MKTLILSRHTEEPLKGWLSVFRDRSPDEEVHIEYDDMAPCWMCGLPVGEASMGGTLICPACDCGMDRQGRLWELSQAQRVFARYKENKERHNRGEPALPAESLR